jgi:hypothetical protein
MGVFWTLIVSRSSWVERGRYMAHVTLYTRERYGAGLTITDVCRVKGAVRLRVASDGEVWEYPIKNIGFATMKHEKGGPVLGRAELHLQIAEEDIDLARCKGAVALVVSHGREATVYWLYGGLCEDVEFIPSGLFVQGKIEARCCPDGYELPPQIPDLMPAKAVTGRP